MADYSTPTKICTRCSKEYPATAGYFVVDKRYKNSFTICHECNREKSRHWREANPEKRLVSYKRYYQANLEKRREAHRRWEKANPEKKREYGRRYYQANPEKTLEKGRRWRKANPEKARAADHRRLARKQQAGGSFTGDDIRQMLAAQQGQCFYCACDISADYHIEHKIPLSRGGTNYPNNLALACPTCNLRKGTQTAEEFLESMGGD